MKEKTVVTVSKLLDDVMLLPKSELLPGVPIEKRTHEIPLLAPLAPDSDNVKRACILTKDGTREILIRVLKEAQFGGYRDIIVRREGGEDLVTLKGARLHLTTVEEIHQYVAELCSENAH